MLMCMLVCVSMFVIRRMAVSMDMAVAVIVCVFVRMITRVRMCVRLGGEHVDFCSTDAATHDLAHFKTRTHIKGSRGVCQCGERDACIHKGA